MHREYIGALGAVVSGMLLLFTAHPLWLLTLVGSSLFYGWNLGQRLIPAEENGA